MQVSEDRPVSHSQQVLVSTPLAHKRFPLQAFGTGREPAFGGQDSEYGRVLSGEELAGCGTVPSQAADPWRKMEDIPVACTEFHLGLQPATFKRRHL